VPEEAKNELKRDENLVYGEWREAGVQERPALEEELVKLLRRHAFALCWRFLRENRPDIVNYAVYKALKNMGGLSTGEGKVFSTWFHRIVQNECNSWLRKKKQHSGEQSLDENSDIFEAKTHKAIEAKLMADSAIAVLEPADQTLVRMVMRGDNYADIGKVFNRDHLWVAKRWERLLKRLRKILT
jgi:RNA polymerase sigma factor (sigma-70 family)